MKTDSLFRRPPTRREMLRILAVGGVAGVAFKLGLSGRFGGQPVTRARVLMGTGVHLTVVGDDREAAEAAADATLDEMAALETLLSRHRSDSELSILNTTGRLDDASDALREVLALADHVSRMGDGAFDVSVLPVLELYQDYRNREGTLPPAEQIESAVDRVDQRSIRIEGRTVTLGRDGMRLTLDGVAKGWVVDRGVGVLRDRGFADVLVEAGGDLVAGGLRGGGAPWRIGIQAPRPGLALNARFETEDRAVATSGDYMQPFTADYKQHHILDPRRGYSSPELASSTVVAPTAALADALATLTMVLGPLRGRALIEDLPDCEAYFIAKDLEVTRTTGFTVL